MKYFIKSKREEFVPEIAQRHSSTRPSVSDIDGKVVIANLTAEAVEPLRNSPHFEVYEDLEFKPLDEEWWKRQTPAPMAGPPPWANKSQADVMKHNRAAEAWTASRGARVTIAVVDTGVDGSMPEFHRRSSWNTSPSFQTAWEDSVGHGTMCAAIACGSTEQGGRYDGVAPDATLLAARTTLYASDLYLVYQDLLRSKRKQLFPGGLVVSNSYGLYTCTAPAWPEGHPYAELIRTCIADGIVFVFAAGNNHGFGLCKFPAADDHPNSIWAVNSIDEVITVGTVNWNESNQEPGEHSNSSRGPGQWSVSASKPDVVAPTYGEVAWGGQYRSMEWWGTSGACPQVAGLAALLLAKKPGLTPSQVATIIKQSARKLPHPAACVGSGIIDCAEAIKLV